MIPIEMYTAWPLHLLATCTCTAEPDGNDACGYMPIRNESLEITKQDAGDGREWNVEMGAGRARRK